MEACLANLATIDLARLSGKAKNELDWLLGTYSVFQTTYYDDPAGFARDCIKWEDGGGPTGYQIDILNSLVMRKRVCVRSPHGAGKTALAAMVVLWFALTRDGVVDWKVPMTASAWRQLTKFLLPEVKKFVTLLNWAKIGRQPFTADEMLMQNLKLKTGEAFAVASNNSELIEGCHATEICMVYDEAKAIPAPTFDATEGMFAGAGDDTEMEAFAVAISTPGPTFGRFYEIFQRTKYPNWHVRHITLEEAMAAGRISAGWVEQCKRQWGESSAIYQNRVLGEFCAGDESGIIPLSWIKAANERWHKWQDAGFPGQVTAIGVDVGGGLTSGDQSVLAIIVDGTKVLPLKRHSHVKDPDTATMEIVGHVAGALRRHGGIAYIDAIGIGAGVLHRLIEQGLSARAFIASKGTNLLDQIGELGFMNWRAAAWWTTREMLDPSSGLDVCLPPDDGGELMGELAAPGIKRITSTGKMVVESKEDLRRPARLGRSTDSADAVVQGLVGPILCMEEDGRVGGERSRIIDRRIPIGADY